MSRNYNIAVIPGDGTGPEVTKEAVKVLEAASTKFGFGLNFTTFDLGGERYLRIGETLPADVLWTLRRDNDRVDDPDAILLGAIGHPEVKPGILEQGILLNLRFSLDLYINQRPVKLYPGVQCPLKDKGPEDIDFTVIRENTEGLYANAGGFLKKGTGQEIAIQESINTYYGVKRCIRYAFESCRAIHPNVPWKGLSKSERADGKIGKVTLCGKKNVLTFAFDLWQRVFDEVAQDFPHIIADYVHVDACCMFMVKNPKMFDVIVTDNMFGDIITDIGAEIQGGMGIAAGANLNPIKKLGMFEPIGGSAPKYAGQNIINPLAAICAGAMMLDFLGEPDAARLIEFCITTLTVEGFIKSMAAGKMGMSTSEIGDTIAGMLANVKEGTSMAEMMLAITNNI